MLGMDQRLEIWQIVSFGREHLAPKHSSKGHIFGHDNPIGRKITAALENRQVQFLYFLLNL